MPTRRISFEESLHDLPKHFAAGDDLIMSHLVASLSAVFPDGEDFFVRSVRHYRSEITDPELKRQVAGFIGQESIHGREHRALNGRLDALGYPSKRAERVVRRVLTTRERMLSPENNLAVTAALEHFTATLAELTLTDETMRNLIDHQTVRELFVWHALEESEHKAVAFDVYRAVGGRERTRVMTMKVIRIAFVVATVVQMMLSLLGDRATYRPGRLRRSWRHFKQTPFMQPELWERLRDYDRPGFHPDDRDTTELVAKWREELFGVDGSLNDKLTAPAAAAA
ncbi:MAG: metal-dependent hydrolase [Actinobacteria bacterium]|nr:metal-dependent hydrolase [Actinomycetota bacterium]